MQRSVGVANLIQAGLYGALAAYLWSAWPLAGAIAGVCALGQLSTGGALLLGRTSSRALLGSVVTLAGVALLVGLWLHGALHVARFFGPSAARTSWISFGAMVLALPWFAGLPAWQVFTLRRQGLLWMSLLLLPPAWGLVTHTPTQTWVAQADHEQAVAGAHARWTGADQDAPLPTGSGPSTILLTGWRSGEPTQTVRADGRTLAAAIEQALARLPPPTAGDDSLVLHIARASYKPGLILPPSRCGTLSSEQSAAPTVLAQPDPIKPIPYLPLWKVPVLQATEGTPTCFDGVVAGPSGTAALVDGWVRAPELTAESLLAAAEAGGQMLIRNQKETGRFTYIVSEKETKRDTYSLPRHAGTTWFLARLAVRTGDPTYADAANRGLEFLENTSEYREGLGSFVRDTRRPDGRAWVGTTALSVLAATTMESDLALPWGRFLVSALNQDGQARGDIDLKSSEFPSQQRNTYAQGQVQLALASLVRAGHHEFTEPLERTANFSAGSYAASGVGAFSGLDEHWMCLAAWATEEATGQAAGHAPCQAYLAREAYRTPGKEVLLASRSGPAAGLAEALVAGALLDPSGPHQARALAYGRQFLQSAIRAADTTFLRRGNQLLGGFRDSPFLTDVQIDSVQHIGCALLGVEALISTAHPGSFP